MLAGVYWPLEVMPKYMQAIAEFLPQTWARAILLQTLEFLNKKTYLRK